MSKWISNIFLFAIALPSEICQQAARLAKKFVGKWWYSRY